jgi:hypothetical protein
MIYLKINTDQSITYPYTISQLKQDNPNTSFPFNINVNTLIDFGVYGVISVPAGSDYTKNYIETTPILISNKYYQNWDVVDASQEEINQRINNKWSEVRNVRNQYLKDSDWTQLPDSPLSSNEKEEWLVYRQQLRDVTLQNDPFNIIWPISPND